MRKYYRDGDVDGCRQQIRDLISCNDPAKQEKAAAEQQRRTAEAPPSSKVWALRTSDEERRAAWDAELGPRKAERPIALGPKK